MTLVSNSIRRFFLIHIGHLTIFPAQVNYSEVILREKVSTVLYRTVRPLSPAQDGLAVGVLSSALFGIFADLFQENCKTQNFRNLLQFFSNGAHFFIASNPFPFCIFFKYFPISYNISALK